MRSRDQERERAIKMTRKKRGDAGGGVGVGGGPLPVPGSQQQQQQAGAGVVTERSPGWRGPGAMTSLHQEQGYGGSESRSAEKVEAAGFLLRSTHHHSTRPAPGSARVNSRITKTARITYRLST